MARLLRHTFRATVAIFVVISVALASSDDYSSRDDRLRRFVRSTQQDTSSEPNIFSLLEFILTTIDDKMRRVENLDRAVVHLMRRIERLDTRVSENVLTTQTVLAKLRALEAPPNDLPEQHSISSRISALNDKVEKIDTTLSEVKNQLSTTVVDDELEAEASERRPVRVSVGRSLQHQKLDEVTDVLETLKKDVKGIDRKLQFHINLVSENMDRVVTKVDDIYEAVMEDDDTPSTRNLPTYRNRTSKLDNIYSRVDPLVIVRQKMDEMHEMVSDTKAAVNDLVPMSDVLLEETQRQQAVISDIHDDLNRKTDIIIQNLRVPEVPTSRSVPQAWFVRDANPPATSTNAGFSGRVRPNRIVRLPDPSDRYRQQPDFRERGRGLYSDRIRLPQTDDDEETAESSDNPVASPSTQNKIVRHFPSRTWSKRKFPQGVQSRQQPITAATTTSTTTSTTPPTTTTTTSTTTTTTRPTTTTTTTTTTPRPVPTKLNNSFTSDENYGQEVTGYTCADLKEQGVNKSGVYYLRIRGTTFWHLKVYCEMEVGGGGWLVIQRRDDFQPRENFNRDWEDYRSGFGDPRKEFWLGNENIHMLTVQQDFTMRVDLEDFDGNKSFAQYSTFRLHDEKDNYKLEIGGYVGDAGDSLNDPRYGSNLSPFSTYNRDNDRSSLNCASMLKGGWWWRSCGRGLNGLYLTNPKDVSSTQGIVWFRWRGWDYTLKRAAMMIRPVTFVVDNNDDGSATSSE